MNIITKLDKRLKAECITQPIVILVNEFNPASLKTFREELSKAHNTGQTIIPVVVDSYGGHIYSLMAMASLIESSKIPVSTIALGKAMSAGAALVAFGAKGHRYISPDSHMMVHQAITGTGGSIAEVNTSVEHSNALNNQILEKMSLACGHEKEFFSDLVKERGNMDIYLTPKESKRYGLVDKIGVPTLTVEGSVQYTYGVA